MMKENSAIIILPNGVKKKKKTDQEEFEQDFVYRRSLPEKQTVERIVPSPS